MIATWDMHGGYGHCPGSGTVWVDDGEASNSYRGGHCPMCWPVDTPFATRLDTLERIRAYRAQFFCDYKAAAAAVEDGWMPAPTPSGAHMTPAQKKLARHALGLTKGRRQSYRNRFVAGPGHADYPEWMKMYRKGYADMRSGRAMFGGDDLFWLTRKGAELALEAGETLDVEDFPHLAKEHP